MFSAKGSRQADYAETMDPWPVAEKIPTINFL